MDWIVLGGSGVAVLGLGGVAGLLGLGRGTRMMRSPAEAMAAAEQATANFHAAAAVISHDGRAALALGDDGRVLAVKMHGARAATREVAWAALRQTPEGIVVETGERRFSAVTLIGVTALDVRRLGMPVAEQLTTV